MFCSIRAMDTGTTAYIVYRYGKRIFRTTGERTKTAMSEVVAKRLKKAIFP